MVLVAVARGKARMERILGVEGPQPREDVITSAILAPLAYLDRPGRAIEALLGGERGGSPWQSATRVEIDFWPPLPTGIPDAVVRAYVEERLVARILVEVKWGAALQPGQVLRYLKGLPQERRARTTAVLLGAETHHDTEPGGDGEGARPRPWRDASLALRALGRERSAAGAWARDVHRFLQASGRSRIFEGFEGAGLEKETPLLHALPWRFPAPPPRRFGAVLPVEVAAPFFTRGGSP